MNQAFSSVKIVCFAILLTLGATSACDSDDEPLSHSGGGTAGAGGSGAGGTGASGGFGASGGSAATGGSPGGGGAPSGGAAGAGGSGAGGSGGLAGAAGTDGGGDADAPNNVAFPGAPPTMLHQPYGCLNNCISCHGDGTGGAPKTPHPERLLCRQCHLPQANVPNWVDNTFGK